MTPQEREMLQAFLQQLGQTQAQPKDPDADSLIRDAVARQPDASYLLVQRAMGLDLAVQAAQAQITRLQAELEQLRSSAGPASFLSGANTWGRHATAGSAMTNPGVPLRPYAAQGTGAAPLAYGAAPASSWASGMLGSVAATAAGVVAGSLIFQGIENLMGHHSASSAAAFDPVQPLASSDTNSPSEVLQSFRSDVPADSAPQAGSALYSESAGLQDYGTSGDDSDLLAGDDSYQADSGDYA